MALTIRNHRLYSLNFDYDAETGVLAAIFIRVNRDLVDEDTGRLVTHLSTSDEKNILPLLEPTITPAASNRFAQRIKALLPTLEY